MTRAYLPFTLGRLRSALRVESVSTGTRWVHAVTPTLRSGQLRGGDDDEVLEYLALEQAANASVPLLDASDIPRRVVVVVEVGSVLGAGDASDLTLARLEGEVPWRAVAAVHVDSADAEPLVRAAVTALGSPAEERAFEALEDHTLGWYAVQELDDLLGQLP